jgi:hypothetical protein
MVLLATMALVAVGFLVVQLQGHLFLGTWRSFHRPDEWYYVVGAADDY